jgi:DNA-binding SARP family transcriptional activator
VARSDQPRWAEIRLLSLGDCAVLVGERRVDPRAHVIFAALLRLVAERGKSIPRATLQTLLWPNALPAESRHRLRQTIYMLKKLGVELAVDGQSVRLVATVQLDYREAVSNCRQDCSALYQDFLPGYAPQISSAFESWLESLRTQTNLEIRSALLTSIGIQRANGHWANVELTARRCLMIDPLNEEATLALAEAAAMAGSKFEALRLLDHYSAELEVQTPKLALQSTLLRHRISDRLPPVQPLFVGRDSEIAPMATLIRQTRRREGGGYLIVGEVGVGKTRILQEVKRIGALESVFVASTECLPSDSGYPLSVLTRLTRTLQTLPGALGCSPSSLKYLARITEEETDFAHPDDDLDSASSIYAAIRNAIIELVAAITDEVRLLLVIDDLDHADKWSAAIIADLTAISRSQPLVLVMAARAVQGSVAVVTTANRGLRSHTVQPLTLADSRMLIESLTSASHGGLTGDLKDLYVAMAEGNPLSIYELSNYWTNCGHLAPVPFSIESALQRRLAELDGPTALLLQTVVLLGHNATTDRLTRLLGLSKTEVLRGLELLEKSGAIRWESSALRCSHTKLAELVTTTLSATAAISLHGRIASLLRSELEPPHDSRILWDCANHYCMARSQTERIDLLSRCSDRLTRLGLPNDAVSVWERALELCHSDQERLPILEKLIAPLRMLGDLSRISRSAEEVKRIRKELQFQNPAWADWQIDVLEARMYALEDVAPILAEASTCLTDESTAPATRVRAGICAMICACNLQDSNRLERLHDLLISLSSTIPFREADRHIIGLIFHTELGDLERGAVAGRDLVALARRAGSPSFLAQCLRRYARVLRLLGKFGDALAALNEATQLAQWMGSRSYVLRARSHTALTLIEKADLKGARSVLAHAITREDRRFFPYRVIEIAQLRAMLALIEGNQEEAKRVCDSRLFSSWRSRSSRSTGRIMYYSLAVSTLASDTRHVTTRLKKQTSILERDFLRLQASGEQDFIALALCKALLAQGESSRTQEILTNYVEKYRRELYPVPVYLSHMLTHGPAQVSNSSDATAAP